MPLVSVGVWLDDQQSANPVRTEHVPVQASDHDTLQSALALFDSDNPMPWHAPWANPSRRRAGYRQESENHIPELLPTEEVEATWRSQDPERLSRARRRPQVGETGDPGEHRLKTIWSEPQKPTGKGRLNQEAQHSPQHPELFDPWVPDEAREMMGWLDRSGEVPPVSGRSPFQDQPREVSADLIDHVLWRMDLCGPALSAPGARVTPPTEPSSQHIFTLTQIDSTALLPAAWIVRDEDPRKTKDGVPRPGESAPPLTSWFLLVQDPQSPGTGELTARSGETVNPPWISVGLIVVDGPFTVIATDVYQAGFVEADVVEVQ